MVGSSNSMKTPNYLLNIICCKNQRSVLDAFPDTESSHLADRFLWTVDILQHPLFIDNSVKQYQPKTGTW